MPAIPRDKKLDSSLDFLREGYAFICNRRASVGSDIFSTRLLLNTVICVSGRDAAQLLYNPAMFKRHGAAPKFIQKTLTGVGGVQSLDDEAHRNRKAMFMAVMTRENLAEWTEVFSEEWQSRLMEWSDCEQVTLFKEMQTLLCAAACRWAGVPLGAGEAEKRGAQLGKMIDGFATLNLRHWRARKARKQTESWMAGIIERVRSRKLAPAGKTALYMIAWHQDEKGRLLDAPIAAVEMLNILRPIVAIATYITFEALALQRYPECRRKLESAIPEYAHWFVQEVRRYFPFTPIVGALAKEDIDWKGYRIKAGQRVILDVYGLQHDPRIWEKPEQFHPERFSTLNPDPFAFMPQGGGDFMKHHRCAGEWLTIETMKTALDFLIHRMEYIVPEQDFYYPLSRIPTLPESGFIMTSIRGVPRLKVAKAS